MTQIHSAPIMLINKTDACDKWDIAWFKNDPDGLELADWLLGVRVNGGTWIEVSALEHEIARLREDGPPT